MTSDFATVQSTHEEGSFTESTTTTTRNRLNSKSSMCNIDGHYNGFYEIKIWPPVENGSNSIVHCPQGKGYAKWKCEDNLVFDSKGPDWSECENWLNELKPIKTMFYASEVIETISKNTEKNNSLLNIENVDRVVEKIKEIQNFVKNQTGNNLDFILDLAKKMITCLSNILEQEFAWVNPNAEKKINTSTEILSHIPSIGFMVAKYQDNDHKLEIIRSKNIKLNTFYFDPKEGLSFPENISHKVCSIYLPKGIAIKTNNQTINSAVGAIIYKMREFLLGGVTQDMTINSEVLSFSLTEGFETTQLNKDVKIK
jgi:hypothetical protein